MEIPLKVEERSDGFYIRLDTPLYPNAKWYGPFTSEEKARQAARSTFNVEE